VATKQVALGLFRAWSAGENDLGGLDRLIEGLQGSARQGGKGGVSLALHRRWLPWRRRARARARLWRDREVLVMPQAMRRSSTRTVIEAALAPLSLLLASPRSTCTDGVRWLQAAEIPIARCPDAGRTFQLLAQLDGIEARSLGRRLGSWRSVRFAMLIAPPP